MPGRSWPARAWDDLRLAGLKLIFLIVTRAVPLLGLSRREGGGEEAEVLMLRHQLAVAERERPRAHPRLDVAGPSVAGAPCGDGGWPGRTSRGDTGGSTASSRGPASRWRHPRSGRSSRAPGSTGLRAGMARAGRSSSGPRRRGSWRWASSPVGAENLCHQAIFMNHAPGAVTPLDPEMVQVGDAVGYRAERRGLFQGAVRPVGVAGVLVLAQHDHQVPLVPD